MLPTRSRKAKREFPRPRPFGNSRSFLISHASNTFARKAKREFPRQGRLGILAVFDFPCFQHVRAKQSGNSLGQGRSGILAVFYFPCFQHVRAQSGNFPAKAVWKFPPFLISHASNMFAQSKAGISSSKAVWKFPPFYSLPLCLRHWDAQCAQSPEQPPQQPPRFDRPRHARNAKNASTAMAASKR